MNSKKHRLIAGNKPWTSSGNSLPPHVGGQTLEEMQDLWDELNRRVGSILFRHRAQPYRVDPALRQAIRRHRRQIHWDLRRHGRICRILLSYQGQTVLNRLR